MPARTINDASGDDRRPWEAPSRCFLESPAAYAQPVVNIKAGPTPAPGLRLLHRAIELSERTSAARETAMPRHAQYVPHGVIPAVLLPFNDDLSIDEKSFRSHLRDVAATKGISAITINAHSTEVASLTFEEQRRVLAIAQDEIGERLPLVNGVWADGSIEAARIARMVADGGTSALLIFPPGPFTLGQSPDMALAHFKRIAEATYPPLIAFQYPLATGQGYPRDTLLKMVDQVPSIRAIKDWAGNVP